MRLRRLSIVIVLLAWSGPWSGSPHRATPGRPASGRSSPAAGVTNIVEPGMYRTADGTLHVAIVRGNSDDTESIDVAHVSESGQLLGRTEVIRALGAA